MAVAIAGAVVAVYALVAGLVLPRELPGLWQRLLGLGCAALGTTVFALLSRQPESPEELLRRARRGQHADFGKRLRQTRTAKTTVQLPVVGEVSRRTLGSAGVFVLVAAWWFTPLAPIRVGEQVVEDLSVPLGNEIVTAVLVMADANTATLQVPILPPRARELAELIDEDAGPYHRGRKAMAQGQFQDARSLLARAEASQHVPQHQIYLARAQNEMYARQFADAIPWYDKARQEKPDDPMLLCQTAAAWLQAGKFAEAEPLVSQAVKISRERTSEDKKENPVLACALHVQAVLYVGLGKPLGEAVLMCLEARNVFNEDADDQHAFGAARLNNQAVLYLLQAKYAGAQELSRSSREIWTETLGPTHPHVAASLGNQAMVLLNLGQYAEADELLSHAGIIRSESLPPKHPARALGQGAEALVDLALGRYDQAKPLVEQALLDSENALGHEHPNVAAILAMRASLSAGQARYARAEQYCTSARSIVERIWGPRHPYMAGVLNDLAELYLEQGRAATDPSKKTEAFDKAEQACGLALETVEQTLGEKHPAAGTALNTKGRLEIERGQSGRQARLDLERAKKIRDDAFGEDQPHPDRARTMANQAARIADAIGYQKAIRMGEKVMGHQHPEVARMWYGLGKLHAGAGKRSEASECLQQALDIQEKVLVPCHPDLAATLETYALALGGTDSKTADKMAARAKAIRAKHREVDQPE